ncbi:hypothetical protein AAG906_026030 [Vitis piasezkii]
MGDGFYYFSCVVGVEDDRRGKEMGESTREDYEPHLWTGGGRLVVKAKSTAKGRSSGAASKMKEGGESQKIKKFPPVEPKQVGEVWVEGDKAHSNDEEWHRASNAMPKRRAQSPHKPRPLVKANLGWERGASSTRGDADNQQRSTLKASIHSKGKAKLCKFFNVEERAGSKGFVHRGSSVTVFPSNPVTREKGLNSVGTRGMMVVENFEVSYSPHSQSSLSIPFPLGLALPPLSPSDPVLPNSVIQSQYPMKSRVISEMFFKKIDDGALCQDSIGNPNLDVVESQLTCLNQMSEGINSLKTMPNTPIEAPNLVIVSQGEAEFSPLEQILHWYLRPVGTGMEEVCDEGLLVVSSQLGIRRVLFACRTSAKLKEWNKNSFGVLKERKKSILSEIANIDAVEQEGVLSFEFSAQRALRKGKLEELILKEEIHWRQKGSSIPFLFTIVVDVLSRMLLRAEERSLLEGFSVDYLISWDVVCKPKAKGGLGFGKISLRNLALLGKWLWRYPRESSALWHQVILSIYGTHSNGWDANTIEMGKEFTFGKTCGGGPTFGIPDPRLFRVVTIKIFSYLQFWFFSPLLLEL